MKRVIIIASLAIAAGLAPLFSQEKPATDKPARETQTAVEDHSVDMPWKNPTTGDYYATSRVKFVLTATDNLSDVDYIEYKLDETQFQKYQGPFNITDEGPHTVLYRAVDKAGNRETDHVYHVTIDNTAPEVRVLSATPFFVNNGKYFTAPGNSFTFRVADTLSGIKSVLYGVNSTEMKAYNNDVIKFDVPGSQLIQYRAEDNVGNKTTEGSLLVEVDADKPVVEIIPTNSLTVVGDKQYARRHTGFRVRATDNGSGITKVMVKIDGAQEWQAYNDVLTFDTETAHTIEAMAEDSVGNKSDSKVLTFIVDDNPPVTEIKTSVE